MKRLLTRAAIAAASLAALFVAASALAYWLVDVDALVEEQVARYEPEIEKRLGRDIEIGAISTRFFPTLGARFEGIRVAGAAGDGPLLEIGQAGVDLDLLGALLSLGKEVSLDAIYLEGVRVELVRNADGSLSVADILSRQQAEESEEPEPAGLDPALVEMLQRISIDEIRLAGEIHLIDRAAPGGEPVESAVRSIDLRLRDLRLGDRVQVQLQAAAFADRRNIDLRATVGPIPADLQLDGLPRMRDVRARIDGLDLAPVLPYLPLDLKSAVLAADFSVPELGPERPAKLAGYFAINRLHFEGGTPIDIRLDAKLAADLQRMGATIDELRLQVGSVELHASGAVHDLATSPRFENFLVRSQSLDPQVLLAAFPMAGEALPEGAKVAGIATLEMRASGKADNQSLNLAFDMGGVDIHLPGTFAKPRGTPFALRIEGDFTPSSAALRKANLRLDELDLDVTGSLRDFAAPIFDFTLAAKPFSVDRLVRLLPQAAAQLQEAKAKAAGRGSLSGHLKGSPGKLSANLALSLADVDIALPDTTVRGGIKARLFANGDPATRLQAGLLLDAGESVIQIPGLLQKEAATPLIVDIVADQRGETISFEKFDVRLAELQLAGRGALGPADTSLQVRLHPLDLERFARTVPAIPAERVKEGSVQGMLQVRGNPAQQESLSIELQQFALRLGKSDLQATATVRNLAAPDIRADVRSRYLDVDTLFPPAEGTEGEAAAPPAEDDPELKKISAVARFDVARALVRGRELEALEGRFVLKDGVVTVEEARFDIYGGRVQAAGSRAEIWRGQMPFHAKLAVQQVEIDRLLSGEFDVRGLLSGKTDLDLELDGVGFDFESLEQHLTGGWDLSLLNGKLSTAQITSSVVGGLAKLPGMEPQRLASEGDLRDLFAGFQVEKGRMNLKKPLRLGLDGNRMELDGAVGIGGDLFLDGTYFVSPALVSRLSGGRCSIAQEAAVPLKVGGKAASPSVKPDTGALARLVAEGCLSDSAKQAVSKLVGQEKVQEAQQKVEEVKAQAQQQIDQAKADAEAAAAAAKSEADRKAREAEEKAKQKAKDEAKKLKNRMGF